jgi:putative phosphoesterase
MRVGLISDTHGLLRPEAVDALQGCAHILHAGDVGDPEILAALRDIAPLTAIRGNVDTGSWAKALPERAMLTLSGCPIYMLHDVKMLGLDSQAKEARVVLSGHTHKPLIEKRGEVLHVNPGAAGPRRFALPVTIGFLTISEDGTPRAEIHSLEVPPKIPAASR